MDALCPVSQNRHHRFRLTCALLLVAGIVAGCGSADMVQLQGDGPVDSVLVYFTRAGRQEAVLRHIEPTDAPLEPAIRALMAGPTNAEIEQGFDSHFSAITAAAFHRVEIREDGLAIVDMFDFSRQAPAGADAGGAQLLGELNLTVFQFHQIRSVVYRFEGSCTRFWEWLDQSCLTVRRSDVIKS